jgi:hypothetical protein
MRKIVLSLFMLLMVISFSYSAPQDWISDVNWYIENIAPVELRDGHRTVIMEIAKIWDGLYARYNSQFLTDVLGMDKTTYAYNKIYSVYDKFIINISGVELWSLGGTGYLKYVGQVDWGDSWKYRGPLSAFRLAIWWSLWCNDVNVLYANCATKTEFKEKGLSNSVTAYLMLERAVTRYGFVEADIVVLDTMTGLYSYVIDSGYPREYAIRHNLGRWKINVVDPDNLSDVSSYISNFLSWVSRSGNILSYYVNNTKTRRTLGGE